VNINWGLALDSVPVLLQGAKITLQFTVVSVFFGMILGLVFALGRMAQHKLIRIISSAYIDFF
jgi:His/Glu/Gln/Arg/opine family amino acid ABC transporter permease subunit